MVREPAVAGQFYALKKEALKREVEALIDLKAKREDAIGVISPHAGYLYSGFVAGSVLSSILPKKTYVIIGPNHTGLGETFGIDENEHWNTPLGNVEVDRDLADAIMSNCAHVKSDSLSHAHEHSIEVQIPFLQILRKDFKIVPLIVSYADPDLYREAGMAIVRSIKDLRIEKDTVIIASSDMTHYESHEIARKKDSIAIEAILALDEKALIEKVAEFDITMCGYAPAAIMLTAVKELGAKNARLVKYQTSADASGDYSSVVGYAGIIIK